MANKKISQLTERTVLETTDVIPVVASGGIETNKTLLSTLLAWIQVNLIGKFNTPTGTASQYIRGDGQLAAFPTSTGGGSSVAYYLNGGVDSDVSGYKQMSKTAIVGTTANFILNADGVIAEFMTDAGDPNLVEIKAGNWNFEMYFSASSAGGTPKYYVSLLKYDGTTFTPIASSIAAQKPITSGTNIDLYLSSLAIPLTTLSTTDRLVIRVNVIHSGRTITLHTQNGHLCEIITNFASGVSSINGVTKQTQYLGTGQSGNDFNIDSQDASGTHYFNLPTASSVNRGALSASDWNLFYNKVTSMGMSGYIPKFNSFNSLVNSPIYVDFNNVSIGGAYAFYPMHILTESGNVSLYASYDIVAFSDISVKENLRPIENVLSRICKSRGVLYDRIDSGAKDNIGFIAQELEVEFPELVIENEDGTKAVKYQNAVAVLFEAVKEQQKQIDDLKELVNKLISK